MRSKILLVIILCIASSHDSFSQGITYTWTGTASTAWNNSGNWTNSGGGTFPGDGGAGDIVIISGTGNSPTLSTTLNNSIASIEFTSTANRTLTITGVTLTVTGDINLNTTTLNAARTHTITGTGTLVCDGNFSLGTDVGALGTGNGSATNYTLTCSITSLQIGGNLILYANQSSGGSGGKRMNPVFSHTSGTVELAGSIVTTNEAGNNICTYTLGTSSPTLRFTGTTLYSLSGTGTNTFTYNGSTSTVDYAATSSFTIPTTPTVTYHNLTISGGNNNVKTAAENFSVAGALTVRAASTLAMGTFTISSPLGITLETGSGLNGAAITGTGLITLGASGGVTVNNSPAGVGATAASIATPISLANVSRTFLINDDGNTTNEDLTISGVISSSGTTGGIVKSGAGTLELTGTNTYTGTTSITAGIIAINTIANAAASCSLGAPAVAQSTISITGGATLRYTGSGHSSSRPVALASTGAIIDASGSGLLTLSGAMSGNTFGIVFTGTGTGLYSGAIGTTTGTVTKTGTGTWELSGTSTYTGATTISGGTLMAGAAVAVSTNGPFGNASTAIVMGNAATTTNNWSPTLLIDGAFTMARTITIANQATSGTYTIGGNTDNNATFSGAITFSQPFSVTQVATTGGNILTISGAISGGVTGTKLITFNNEGAVTKTTGIISNGTGVTQVRKQNTGTLTISTANTHTGGTTLASGILNINNAAALGDVTGTFTIDGGTIQNTTAGLITTSNHPITWNANFTFSGSQPLNLGTGTVTMNADIQITTVNSGVTLTFGGAISAASRSLTKLGAGTLSFGSQTISLNGVSISAGTLVSTSGTMNVAGTFTNDATFTNNAGTVLMSSASSSIVNNSTLTFNNLTINVTPTAQSQYNVSFSVAAALSIPGGVTFAPTGGTITMSAVSSSILNTGTKTFNNLTIAATPTAQSQYNTSFGMAGTFTVNGGITFAPTGGTITMSGAGSSISNSGTLTFQNLTIAATPTAQSQYNTSYNIAGTLTVNNSILFEPTGGTITMNNVASAISNSGTLTFNNLTISATPTSQAQYNTSFTVAGTFATSGAITFAPTGGTITMSGTSGAINNASGTLTFQNLTISGTTVSSTGNFAVAATMSVSGVFNPSATSIISGATGTITGTGTVNVTRTAVTPSFGAQYTINTKTLANLTVNYNGGGAQTVDAQNYGNLTISTNGTRTVTFINGGTIRVSGVFTPTATTTTYVVTNNTFEYNGAGAQTITAFTYNNLILSNAGTKTVLASTTVNCLTITLNDAAVLTLPDTSTLNVTL